MTIFASVLIAAVLWLDVAALMPVLAKSGGWPLVVVSLTHLAAAICASVLVWESTGK